MAIIVEGDPKALFSIATTPRCRGCKFFSWIALHTLDPYLIMLSVKQVHIKYHFLSLWYDSFWDWTQVSRGIGKHSNHYANVQSCWSHRFPKLSLTIRLCHPSLPAGLPGYIPCPYWAVVDKFNQVVVHSHVRVYIYIYIYISFRRLCLQRK